MPNIFKNGKFRFPAQLSGGERGEPSGPSCAGSDSGRRREEQEAAPRADGAKKASLVLKIFQAIILGENQNLSSALEEL